MMTIDPKKRVSAENALKNQWLVGHNQPEIVKPSDILVSMDHLKKFSATRAMQKAFLTYISAHIISKEQEKKLRKIFEMLDQNHDGQLSQKEIFEGFKQFYGGDEEELKLEVEILMKRVDLNKNGSIDYQEFLTANMNEADCINQESLKIAFDFFDEVRIIYL